MSRLLAQAMVSQLATVAAAVARGGLGVGRRMPPRMMADSGLGGPELTVLGGGFGGLYTALRLVSLDWSGGPRPRVTLVDRNDRFAFSPMLYELATGTATCWEVAPLYEELLAGTDVEFVQGEVRGLDETERTVRVSPTSDGGEERLLPYDQCVVALGAQPTFGGIPGADEFAQPFYSADDAMAVKQRVKELRKSSERSVLRVCVVGGGYIGAELAANLASSLPSSQLLLTLVHRSDELLTTATSHSRAVAQRKLADAGVDVILNTEVASVAADSLRLVPRGSGSSGGAQPTGNAGVTGKSATGGGTDGSAVRASPRAAAAAQTVEAAAGDGYDLPADLTLWTAGSVPSAVVSALDLPLDPTGRIAVDATMRVQGKPRLYALGDASAVVDAAGTRAPQTAQAAMQQADYLAWNMRAELRDGPSLPFRYLALGEMLSLGEDAASISALGQLVRLSGPLAFAGRRAVYAARMPTPSQAAKVGLSWAVDAAFSNLRRTLGSSPSR